jgi:AAA15 family ATPase/GTPase
MTTQMTTEQRLELVSWRFKPAKLGCLTDNAGVIDFKPLTLVCGQNNTGKTWVMYALYAFLSGLSLHKLPGMDVLARELEREGQAKWDLAQWATEHGKKLVSAIDLAIARSLPRVFNSDPDLFKGSHFDWDVGLAELTEQAIARPLEVNLVLGREKNQVLRMTKKAGESEVQLVQLSTFPGTEVFLSDAIARHLIGNPPRRNVFLMPAERNGLHLFYRELASRRSALLHHASKKDKDININELIQDVMASRYAQPIADYIDWLNDLPEVRKKKNGPFHELAEEVKGIIGGKYEVDAEGDISFTPYKVKRGDGNTPPKLGLHLTSSTVKSLFGLWAYLEFDAQPGDVLMIDEPELNLHPANQRRMARLLARLVNADLRVVVSTHSDYLVREINSLIMLSRPASVQAELIQKYGYRQEELLKPEKVSAWLFNDRSIQPMPIDSVEGIAAATFDEQIHSLNDTSDGIYYAYQEAQNSGEHG